MKYAFKLAMSIMLLLAAVLSIGGYWLLYQDFKDKLDFTENQNINAHLRDKFSLETALIQLKGSELSDERNYSIYLYAADFALYSKSADITFAIYSIVPKDFTKAIYTNIPLQISRTAQLAQLKQGENSFQLIKADNSSYMLISSRVSGTDYMWYLSCFDITSLFTMRDTQLKRFLQIEVAALVVAAVVSCIISYFLTRPIKRLTAASKSIADGAYNLRTNIKSRDEIGQLSRSFDFMAQAISEKVDALNLNLRQRDEFVSAFTHEIKTPMTSILGYSDMLRSGQYSDEERKMAADYIYHESKRLEELSLKLLALMSLSDDYTICLSPQSLSEAFSVFEKSLLQYAQRLSISCASVTVMADTDLLADLLRNLVINALKASEDTVKITAELQDSFVLVSVIDTGCGISQDDLQHITEPFYMADKSRARAQNGSGMGLALGQKIAALHGTSLHFESKLGEGTAVSFTLLRAAEEKA